LYISNDIVLNTTKSLKNKPTKDITDVIYTEEDIGVKITIFD